MLTMREKDLTFKLSTFAMRYPDMIVILMGKQAEQYYARFPNQDVRIDPPYFKKEDNVEWYLG